MQKPFEHTLTEADRAVLTNWLIGLVAFYGSVTIVVIGLIVAGVHVAPETTQQTSGANGHGDTSAALSSSGSPLPNEISTGRPLP